MSVINTNISALIGLNNMRLTNLGLKQSLERLSSGLRINKGADDPSGLAIAKGMEAQIGGIRTAVMNAEDGISLIHTADGALAETHDILMRMRDLAVRAANEATLTSRDVMRINNEMQSLKQELQRKSQAVTFNTKVLFSGGYSGGNQQMLQIGPDNGTNYRLTIEIWTMNNSGLFMMSGTKQVNWFGGGSLLISNVSSGASTTLSTSVGALSMAWVAIDYLNSAVNFVSDLRASLGIQERRLGHIIDDLKAEDINISAAKSRLWDADMASEISEFTRLQILQQSGTAILAQANAQPQSILQLLR
jgi:flagellin